MTAAELRKLTELAAKAMRYTTTHKWNAKRMLLDPPVIAMVVHRNGKLVTTGWNPAEDDGDSRRLEVTLRFWLKDFAPYDNPDLTCDLPGLGSVEIWLEHGDDPLYVEWYKSGDDRAAATRLAVLGAAAALGEAMP